MAGLGSIPDVRIGPSPLLVPLSVFLFVYFFVFMSVCLPLSLSLSLSLSVSVTVCPYSRVASGQTLNLTAMPVAECAGIFRMRSS